MVETKNKETQDNLMRLSLSLLRLHKHIVSYKPQTNNLSLLHSAFKKQEEGNTIWAHNLRPSNTQQFINEPTSPSLIFGLTQICPMDVVYMNGRYDLHLSKLWVNIIMASKKLLLTEKNVNYLKIVIEPNKRSTKGLWKVFSSFRFHQN